MIHELPPMPQGTAEQQLEALRDYLVRLAQSLERAGDAASPQRTEKALESAQAQNLRAVRQSAETLKALIVKNAAELAAYADRRLETLSGRYVAQSDFGNYYAAIEAQVEATARGTLEDYHLAEAVEGLERYTRELSGQIRRGLVEDPVTHEVHLGIAISEKLSFTGQTEEIGGLTYYRLSPGQTLGLYTAEGWQFWIGGVRRGWFSSEDSMLHVSNIVTEERLRVGADWEVSVSGGFGLRYIGG